MKRIIILLMLFLMPIIGMQNNVAYATVSKDDNKISYIGDNATTVFPYNYKIFVDTDLVVTLIVIATGVETVQTITSDYTVSGAGDDDGGNVTMITPPATTEKLVIKREIPQTQLINFVDNQAFSVELIEEGLDRNTMMSQELDERVSRSVKSSLNDDLDLTLPLASAGKALKWNVTEDGLINSDQDPDDLVNAAAASAAAASVSESNAAASESAASSSASDAQSSATAAAVSAAEAAANVGNFENALVSIKTDNYVITSDDKSKVLVLDSATDKAFTFTDIVGNEIYMVKNIGAGLLTLTPDASDTIEIPSLSSGGAVILSGDGTNNVWRIISKSNALDSSCRVVRTTQQTIVKNTWDKVEFETETWDISDEYDNVTNHRYTASTPGYRDVDCAVYWESIELDKPISIAIYKNGTIYSLLVKQSVGDSEVEIISYSDKVWLDATDYIEIFCRCETTNDETLRGVTTGSFVAISKIG